MLVTEVFYLCHAVSFALKQDIILKLHTELFSSLFTTEYAKTNLLPFCDVCAVSRSNTEKQNRFRKALWSRWNTCRFWTAFNKEVWLSYLPLVFLWALLSEREKACYCSFRQLPLNLCMDTFSSVSFCMDINAVPLLLWLYWYINKD